jgi:NTE family protein
MKILVLTILVLFALGSAENSLADTKQLIHLDIFDQKSIEKAAMLDYAPPLRIGLALSGGGARGLAQIGIIKVLDEEGIKFDLICGTSMGGLIGGLYASGMPIDSLGKVALALDWAEFFSNRPMRSTQFITQKEYGENTILTLRFRGTKVHIPSGVTTGQKLNSFLAQVTSRSDYIYNDSFDSLPIPLRICAVDLVSGNEIIFRNGSLGDAMRATTSFPLAFAPFELHDMLLVDGGLLEPIPVQTAINEGADFVIAVNTTSDILGIDDINDPIDIINTTTTIMQLEQKERELALADIVIKPEIEEITATDFSRVAELIKAGEAATRKALPQIREKIDSKRESDLFTDAITIDSLEINASPFLIEPQSFTLKDEKGRLTFSLQAARSHLLAFIKNGMLTSADIWLQSSEPKIIKIDAMPTVRLSAIEIKGTGVLNDTSLLHAAGLAYDDYINSENIRSLQNAADRQLQKLGFDLARARIEAIENDPGKLIIDVDEGRVARFVITGNRRTRSWVIKRNFLLKPGEPYSISRADSGLANIYASGLFEQVLLNLEHGDSGVVVNIDVKEKFSGIARLGLHYNECFRTEALLDLGNDNLFGFGNEAFLRILYGEFRQNFSLNLRADRIYETMYNFLFRIYHDRLKREIYVNDESLGKRLERRTGGSLTVGKQLGGLGNVGLTFGISRLRIEHPDRRVEHTGITALSLASRVDTRDRAVFPTLGSLFNLDLEFAMELLWGEESYQKGELFWSGYIPVASFINIIPRIRIGISANLLPPTEKFYMGGSQDFYGYRIFELVGDKLFNGNYELRLKLPYRFYVSGRFDVGNVWGNWSEVRIDDLLYGYGFRLSYDSYLGPFSISYGRNNIGHDQFYLDLGYDF